MTTVWPIIVLGFVATTLLLLPALLKGTWLFSGDSSVQPTQTPKQVELSAQENQSGKPLDWSYLFVCALLPLTGLLLLLWGGAAGELGDDGWWIPLVVILPTSIGAIVAWNQHRRGDDGDPSGS